MAKQTYQDVYPSLPILDSAKDARASAAELLTLEYFEAEPDTMPTKVFDQHHILLNLKEEPQRVENWRDGEHRDFTYRMHEIIVTPAGVESGWRWHGKSKVIVVTLDPEKFERFAQTEVGVLLAESQLKSLPQFEDPDICHAGEMLRDALAGGQLGSELIFESLARVFLVKLIQKYGLQEEAYAFSRSFTAKHYRRVLDFVAQSYGKSILVEDLAREAALSTSHFAQLFKRTIGMSPMQFVTTYRVEQAKKKLAVHETPLIDIAMSCGFADQAHFSRVFKQIAGESPSKYRARLSQQRDSRP
ncbi:MAG: helix-turn-helix transcriptional regulator [Xanthomonadales bacterium]|nr:helix-turn-helix transcriptional regulator [Xanthomonadales bacterium]